METFKIFVIVFITLTVFYFTESVPLCKLYLDGETPPKSATYSTSEVLEIKSYNLTLLNVRGESMFPTIKDNSQCMCVKKNNYGVNDIISFILKYNGENLAIVHRINSINGDIVITKGDNNNFTDPEITKNDILCSVPSVPRYMVLVR